MAEYDNPAGRLLAVLEGFTALDGKASLIDSWAAVFEVDQADVIVRLGPVADLIRQIQEAVDELDDEYLSATVGNNRDVWARPIFPIDHQFNAAMAPVRPRRDSLIALGMVSNQLHRDSSEGLIPDDAELERLKEQVLALVDEVRDSELSVDLRRIIVSRLLDVLKAIENVRVGGPGAVRHAVEALVGGTAMAIGEDDSGSETLEKVWATAKAVVRVFLAGGAAYAALKGWPLVAGELTAGAIGTDDPPPPPPDPTP